MSIFPSRGVCCPPKHKIVGSTWHQQTGKKPEPTTSWQSSSTGLPNQRCSSPEYISSSLACFCPRDFFPPPHTLFFLFGGNSGLDSRRHHACTKYRLRLFGIAYHNDTPSFFLGFYLLRLPFLRGHRIATSSLGR